MTTWHVLCGGFTKEFKDIIQQLRSSTNAWERTWVGGGTEESAPEQPKNYGDDHRFSEGIERFVYDDSTGTLDFVGSTTGVVNPQYLAVHPSLPVVYASEYAHPGRLTASGVRPDGDLEPLSAVETGGDLAIAVCVHPDGQHAYVAHWGDGALSECRLADDGSIIDVEPVVRGDAQGRTRHHQVRMTPSSRGLLVTDVARDEVTGYRVDGDGSVNPEPVARVAFPDASGPRHVEFHPSGRFVYVVDERASLVHVLAAEDGLPQQMLHSYSTVPATFDGMNMPSEVHLHPAGHTLYVGNRGFDAVTILRVGDSGDLEVVGYEPSLGERLSCVRVDPTGTHLVAGHVDSGTLTVFDIDDQGGLTPAGEPVAAASPRSFVFVRAGL